MEPAEKQKHLSLLLVDDDIELCGRCGISCLLVHAIEQRGAEDIGVVRAQAVENKDIFLGAAELRRPCPLVGCGARRSQSCC